MVVDELVGIVPAVVQVVAEYKEAGVLDVAQRLGPGGAQSHAVAPGVIVGVLVVEVDRVVQKEEAVERVAVIVLGCVAEIVV